VIVRHHNSPWLEECIESVIGQTHRAWEVILWDDGSNDEFAGLAAAIAAKNPKIKAMGTQERQGATVAFKEAVACSSGEIVLLLDSDDWLEPSALEKLLKLLEDSEIGLATALYDERSERGEFIQIGPRCHNPLPPDYARQYLFGVIIFHPIAFRRSLYDLIGPVDLTVSSCCVDRDLILRLTEITKVARIEEVLYHYRLHPDQVSRKELAEQIRASRQITDAAIKRRGLAMETVTSGDVKIEGKIVSWTIQWVEG
jgi:glycosyltransferase involved in cell wall biosynthesis